MTLFKKFLVLSLLSISTSVFAVTPNNTFEGFYAGLGLVGVNTTNKVSQGVAADIDDLGALSIFDANFFNASTSFNSVGGRIAAGYGHIIDRGYVGAEIAYRYAPSNGGKIFAPQPSDGPGTTLLNTGINHVTGMNDISGLVRGGYFFLPKTMFYALIGVNGTNFHANFTGFTPTDILGEQKLSVSSWMAGVTPGAGVEFQVAPSLTLDARYTYTFYGTKTLSRTQSFAFVDPVEGLISGTFENLIKINPSISTVSLTLNWHFA